MQSVHVTLDFTKSGGRGFNTKVVKNSGSKNWTAIELVQWPFEQTIRRANQSSTIAIPQSIPGSHQVLKHGMAISMLVILGGHMEALRLSFKDSLVGKATDNVYRSIRIPKPAPRPKASQRSCEDGQKLLDRRRKARAKS